LKALLRDTIASILSATKVVDSVLQRNNRWLILTFHRVLPESYRSIYPLPNLAVTPDELQWIIETLSPYFSIMPVSAAAKIAQSSRNFSPMLSLSFDDGQKDNVEYALPVLEEQGVKASFYLTTDYIGSKDLLWHDRAAFAWKALIESKAEQAVFLATLSNKARNTLNLDSASTFVGSLKAVDGQEREKLLEALLSSMTNDYSWADMMSWDDAKRLVECGHEIGSHGKSHRLLPQQSEYEQQCELLQSRETIQSQLGVAAQSFCYPNGDYTADTLALLTQGAYSNAVTTYWGMNSKALQPYELNRCDMNPERLVDRKGVLSRGRLLMRLSGFLRGTGR
jgi:peptidoglycan/xylan/chitin deacetylase (PgdA/CDA1 family)